MFDLVVYIVVQTASLAGAVFAIWKGGPAERLSGFVVLANLAIGTCATWLVHHNESVALANDGVAAAALLVITIRFSALWMGGVMLLYAVLFALHSLYLVLGRPIDYFFGAVNNVSWLAIICCLMAGTAVAWRRRMRDRRAPVVLGAQAAP